MPLHFALALMLAGSEPVGAHRFRLTIPSGVHKLVDGGCVDFGKLPPGWTPSPQGAVVESAAIAGSVDGVPVKTAIQFGPIYQDAYGAGIIGWMRSPMDDVPGFTAWMADDGEIVLADGDRKTYRVLIQCVPRFVGRHPMPPTCVVSDRHPGAGRWLEIQFGWDNLKSASALIRGAEAVAALLPTTCPG